MNKGRKRTAEQFARDAKGMERKEWKGVKESRDRKGRKR
jgi:hypothetical protein